MKRLVGGSFSKTYVKKINGILVVKKKIFKKHENKLKNQVRWLIKNQGLHAPQVLKQGNTILHYYYIMPYYHNYISFLEYIEKEPLENSYKILKKILTFLFDEVYTFRNESDEEINKKLDFYINTKIISKIEGVSEKNPTLKKLIHQDHLQINNVQYKNINILLKELESLKPTIVRNSKKMVTNMHGDVTVENILCHNSNFLLLDPNDENSFNSVLVDIGKIYQSLHSNYEFLKFVPDCNVLENKVDFTEPVNKKYISLYKELKKLLDNYLSEKEKELILFHEAAHFARMLPYKQKISKKLVPLYYSKMIILLNEFISNFEK